MKRLQLLTVTCLLLPSLGFASDPTVPRVDNPAEPSEGVETWTLAEQWRAGGEDDAVFFGLIQSAAIGEDGNLYVLDGQLSEVHVYDPDGDYLRTIGREGDGPGEFRRAGGLFLLPGGRVGVITGFPGEVVTLEADGDPGPTISPGDVTEGGFRILFDVASAGDRLYFCGARMGRTDEGMKETRYLSINEADGTETTVLMEKVRTRDFSRPTFDEPEEYFVQGRWDAAPDGRVYAAAERDAYAVNVYSPDGVLERVFTRAYTPYSRTQEEKDAVGSDMMIVVNGERLEMERTVLDTAPCIEGLRVDDDGLIWITNGHADKHDGVFRQYDVFSPEGVFLRQVNVVCPGDNLDDGLLPLGGGRFLRIKGMRSARDAANAGFGHEGDAEAGTDDDAEPLELLFYTRG